MRPLKRVAQWCTTQLFRHMAQLVARPHERTDTNDGQEWLDQSHSLPQRKSGQEH